MWHRYRSCQIKIFRNLTANSLAKRLAIFIVSLVLLIAPLAPTVEAASNPSYKYYDNGAIIGATGGEFGNSTTKISVSSTNSSTYTGSVQVTHQYNDNPAWYAWAVNWTGLGNKTVTCMAGVQISVNSDKKTGAISTPAGINKPETVITSPKSTFINNCSADVAATISDFNQSKISIGGDVNDATEIGATAESDNTRQISVSVYSDKPASKLPSGVKATLSPVTQTSSTASSSISLSFDNEYAVDQIFFKKVEPGAYTICITPTSIFNFDQCQTATKVAGTLLYINFGSSDTVFYVDGKVVNAAASITMSGNNVQGTYGPLTLNIYSLASISDTSNGTKVKPVSTDTHPISDSDTSPIVLKAKFDGIENGFYKVCVDGHSELCSKNFEKKTNTAVDPPDSQIDIPADKSDQFVTAPTSTTSCAIEGIGWIVCPVIKFLAGIADTAFNFLADNFLSTNPSLLNTNSNATDTSGNLIGTGAYTAWQMMRTFANVVLAIAFLVIIFSQITSFGINNYGIKKLLPKLILVAVLINVSFFICQIGVDLSNILGYSLKLLLTNVAGTAVNIPDIAKMATASATGSGWSGIAGTVLAGGAAAGLGVASAGGITLAFVALLGLLLSAVIALLMIFFILIVRQMLIVLLVVMAPLAFAAYLLPNTADWFKKWGKLFTQMLMLFPIIGVIFGASTLASTILKSAWASSGSMLAQIVAAGVLVLPLFLVPSVLKGALKGIGAIGTKIGGLGSQWGGAANKGLTSKYANSGYNKFNQTKKTDTKARIAAGNYKGRGGWFNPRNIRSRANVGFNNNKAFNAVTGGFGASRFLSSQTQNRKDMADAVSMFNNDDDLIEAWATTGGNIAAARALTRSDGHGGTRPMLNDTQMQQMERMRYAGHHRKATSFMAAASAMAEGGKGSTAAIANALGNAAKAGATATDTDGAWQSTLAAYRKNGRGDIVGEMNAHFAANGNATPLGVGQLTATPVAINAGRMTGWSQVSASSVHRNAIDAAINPGGAASYQTFLNGNAENTRQALAGYDQMEARAKVHAQPDMIAAAQLHQAAFTGMASTITNIQTAKTYFGIR